MHSDTSTRSRLAVHLVATLFQSTGTAVLWMLPLLARVRFGAGDWETFFVTAAGPTLLTASIFWNEYLRRVSLGKYLLVYWLIAILPLGVAGWAHTFWQLIICHVIGAVGIAGWMPVNGRLLREFYGDGIRGRVFAVLHATTLAGGMATAYGIGVWLERNGESFRLYMPIAALVQGVGVILIVWLTRGLANHGPSHAAVRGRWSALLTPLLHMSETLRADRRFLRYEQAFMTYGVGWMICNALLVVLADKQFGLSYAQYAQFTQVTFQLTMLVAAFPMGWVLDRLGPVRTSAMSFALLAAYPLGLLLAGGATGIGVASALYGVAMAGVNLGWSLGPVTLAASPEQVPRYMAIHTTLVGLRGVLAQGLGMLIYRATGSFFWPFIIAALAFAWSAVQMWRLHANTRTVALPPPAEPAVLDGALSTAE